jgi:hypothetical protein
LEEVCKIMPKVVFEAAAFGEEGMEFSQKTRTGFCGKKCSQP